MTPLQAIKAQCIECMGGERAEVARCTAPNCSLYPYRFGKNPNAKGRVWTEAEKEKQRAVFKKNVLGKNKLKQERS